MIKFIKHIIVFLLLTLITGEVIVRVTYVMSDIPQRTIDQFGIQKYLPNQEGYWKGGDHKWIVNELGWPGNLPESYENLIIVIGDSYIENFMNPNDCHQAVFLKEQMSSYNFIEAARSGVSLIEAMEISKQTDTLSPKHSLLYVNDNDFTESIYEIKALSDITQLKLENQAIINGQMKAPFLKKILYNCKLLYYFYSRYWVSGNTQNENASLSNDNVVEETNLKSNHYQEIQKLINYIKLNYKIQNKSLVFHPKTDPIIIEMCSKIGFNTIVLDSSKDKDWTFGYDSHWTCYGHKQVARQVSNKLESIN